MEILDNSKNIVKSESFTGASASDKFNLKVHNDGIRNFARIKTNSAVYLSKVQVHGRKFRNLDLDYSKASQSTTEGKAKAYKAVDGSNNEVSCTKLQDNKKILLIRS